MKETKMGNQEISSISDPFFHGKVNMDPSEKAQLHSGDKVCHSFMQNKTNHTANVSPIESAGNPCVAKCSL